MFLSLEAKGLFCYIFFQAASPANSTRPLTEKNDFLHFSCTTSSSNGPMSQSMNSNTLCKPAVLQSTDLSNPFFNSPTSVPLISWNYFSCSYRRKSRAEEARSRHRNESAPSIHPVTEQLTKIVKILTIYVNRYRVIHLPKEMKGILFTEQNLFSAYSSKRTYRFGICFSRYQYIRNTKWYHLFN